jgi:hypothetical protein
MPVLQSNHAITTQHIEQFQEQGYLILDHVLTPEQVKEISDRLDPLFATQFETGIYPDEWYGRPGLSQPNATRQMTGLWRCDRTIARYSLSADIARLNATLMGWDATRYALDSCWIKPPGAPAVSFHRNNTCASSIDPATLITCWVALNDCTADAGTLEIAPGSHRWQCNDQMRFLHAPADDYRNPLWQAAAEAGIQNPHIIPVELPPGSAVFLHGDLWHGSGRNESPHKTRCSFAVSTLPAQARFQPPGTGTGYIFDRYRRLGDLELHTSYYPILWSQTGDRTPFLQEYCAL